MDISTLHVLVLYHIVALFKELISLKAGITLFSE